MRYLGPTLHTPSKRWLFLCFVTKHVSHSGSGHHQPKAELAIQISKSHVTVPVSSYFCETLCRHQADIRALHFPSSASPEPKVSILHLNYSFLSMKSPALPMNAASLSTPCLHLLALSHGIRQKKRDSSSDSFLSVCRSSLKFQVLQYAQTT